MNRYSVDWSPQGYGKLLAVYDRESGLVVAEAPATQRPALDELVRLANVAHDVEQSDTERAIGAGG